MLKKNLPAARGIGLAPCPVCGAENASEIYDLTRDRPLNELSIPGRILLCERCRLLFKIHTTDLERFYSDSYADAVLRNLPYTAGTGMDTLLREDLAAIRHTIFRDASTVRLLDVGSGPGTLLEIGRAAGYTAEGVELSEKLADHSRKTGFTVHGRSFETFETAARYHVVTLFDIIEHLDRPMEALRMIRELLVPGGILLVFTPNHDSGLVKAAHFMWKLGIRFPVRNIFASPHTVFFDSRTLPMALETSGFRVESIRYQDYNTHRPGQPVSRIVLMAIRILEILAIPFHYHGFRMLVRASRPM